MLIYKINGTKKILSCTLSFASRLVATRQIPSGIYLTGNKKIYL